VQAAVISNIAQFRSQTQASTVNAARSAVSFKSLLTKVTRIVVDKPVFHIQNLGGIRDQFLFESGADSIALLPGVAYCLRRFQPLVQQLARSRWVDHIKRNKQNIAMLGQDNDLESFLFEASRQSLFIDLHRWLEFVQSNADDQSQIGYEAGIMADEGCMDSVALRGYANAFADGGQGWVNP
jgi:hypothetical protein